MPEPSVNAVDVLCLQQLLQVGPMQSAPKLVSLVTWLVA